MMTQTVTQEARPANPECTVCAGTGFDLDFGGRCSMCWGFVPGLGGVGETLRAHRTSTTERDSPGPECATKGW